MNKHLFLLILTMSFPLFGFAQTQKGVDIDGEEASGDERGYFVEIKKETSLIAN